MANDQIKGAGDVYEKDLYKDIRVSGEKYLVVIDAINKGLEETTKESGKLINTDPKDLKSLKSINEAIDKTNEAFQQKIKLDKERITIQKKIQKAEDIDAKQTSELEIKIKKLTAAKNELLKREVLSDKARRQGNEKIADSIDLTAEERIQLQKLTKELIIVTNEKAEVNKINKEIAKDSLGLIDLYQKESKRLNELRKQFKNLVLQEGKATDETKKLLIEINELDKQLKDVDAAAGQFQRNVGNYPGAIDSATKSLVGFAASVVGAKLSLDGIKGSLEETAEGSEAVREATSALGGVYDQVSNVVASTALDLFDLGKGLANGEVNAIDFLKSTALASAGLSQFDKTATNFKNTFDRTANATENFTDKIKESAEAQLELEKSIIAFEKAVRPLEIRIAVLNGLISEQQIIAGDSTRSFETLNIAILEGQKLQIERAGILLRIAKEERDVAKERIRVANLAGGATVDLLDAETEAIKKVIEAENELKNELLENEKELRQIKQDRLEKDLDILIDGFDNQKTINERIIANEKETLDKRAALLEQTNKLANDSFREQKKVLEELSAAGVNIDELLKLDATELQKQIRLLEQSEIIEGRTLEVVRERRIVLQDLADAQQDLNDAQQEGIDLRLEIQAQELALGQITEDSIAQSQEAIENLRKDREANEIASLERRLDIAKEGSIEFLNIQKELNDLLLGQQEERINEQVRLEEEAAKRREEIQKALFGAIQKQSDKISERNIEAIDTQISNTEKRQDQLRELANRDVLGADQSLAAEEKRRAELERQKQEEQRKQELKTAGFKILSALLEQGKSPQEALPEVGILLGALPGIIEAIPTFIDGTNTTVADALGRPHLNTKNDGYIIRADGKEKILNPGQSERTGGRTTEDITKIVEAHDKGMYSNLYQFNQPNSDVAQLTNWQSNTQILRKFDSLQNSIVETNSKVEKAIRNQPVLKDVDYHRILKQLTVTMQQENKVTKTRSSMRGKIN